MAIAPAPILNFKLWVPAPSDFFLAPDPAPGKMPSSGLRLRNGSANLSMDTKIFLVALQVVVICRRSTMSLLLVQIIICNYNSCVRFVNTKPNADWIDCITFVEMYCCNLHWCIFLHDKIVFPKTYATASKCIHKSILKSPQKWAWLCPVYDTYNLQPKLK